jgi:hypothetical protein
MNNYRTISGKETENLLSFIPLFLSYRNKKIIRYSQPVKTVTQMRLYTGISPVTLTLDKHQ